MKRSMSLLLLASVSIVAMAAPAVSDGICMPNPKDQTQGWCRLHTKLPSKKSPGDIDPKSGKNAHTANSDLSALYVFPVDKHGRYRRFYLRYVNAHSDQNDHKRIIDCSDRAIYLNDLGTIDQRLSMQTRGSDDRSLVDEGVQKVVYELYQALCLQQNLRVFEGSWPQPPSFSPF